MWLANRSMYKIFSPDVVCVRNAHTRFLLFKRPQYFLWGCLKYSLFNNLITSLHRGRLKYNFQTTFIVPTCSTAATPTTKPATWFKVPTKEAASLIIRLRQNRTDSASRRPHETSNPDVGCVRYARTRFLFKRPQSRRWVSVPLRATWKSAGCFQSLKTVQKQPAHSK